MQYKEVIFEISPIEPCRDILLAYLGELPYDSFIEEEKGLKAYVLTKDFNKAVLEDCVQFRCSNFFEVKDIQQQTGMLGNLISNQYVEILVEYEQIFMSQGLNMKLSLLQMSFEQVITYNFAMMQQMLQGLLGKRI